MKKTRIIVPTLLVVMLVIGVQQVVKRVSDEPNEPGSPVSSKQASPLSTVEDNTRDDGKENVQTTAPVSNNYYQWVLRTDEKRKGQFLDELLMTLQSYGKPGTENNQYFKSFDDLYEVLSLLTHDDSKNIAKAAASIIGILAQMQQTTTIPPISESPFVKSALENTIRESEFDTVRGGAIDAYSVMYPPNDEIVSLYENILLNGTTEMYSSISAVFRAYAIYERSYDLKMPESTLDAATKLLDHPSESVSTNAALALAKSGGVSVLPVLLNRLEKSGVSESYRVSSQILRLDKSDNTVNRLREIAQRSHPTKKYVIEDAIHNR
jgi:hypothetical protein